MKKKYNYFKFVYQNGEKKVVHSIQETSLNDIIQEFQEFLSGVGFYMQGHLEIVPSEDGGYKRTLGMDYDEHDRILAEDRIKEKYNTVDEDNDSGDLFE